MISPRLLVSALAALAVLALVLWGPGACNRLMTEREARKIESGQAAAMLDSIDTSNMTVAERELAAEAIEAEARAVADAIRSAEPGDSNAAAEAALCRMKSYRDTPECVKMRETK